MINVCLRWATNDVPKSIEELLPEEISLPSVPAEGTFIDFGYKEVRRDYFRIEGMHFSVEVEEVRINAVDSENAVYIAYVIL